MIYAKKSLGQNFLQSKPALEKIVAAGSVIASDLILEIGPGQGALTEELLNTGATVIGIEKDRGMIPFLQMKFDKQIYAGKFILLEKDILKFDPVTAPELAGKKYKLIANIPYYITGEIIRMFLSSAHQPEKMVLLVQKEVADRIATRDGKESILSISVKAYCDPKFIGVVKAGSFVPAPNVDSAIMLFDNISKDFFIKNKIDEEKFFTLIKTGFAHKRKKLFSNLKEIAGNADFNEENLIKKTGLDKNVRAEELKLEDWKKF